MKKTKSGKRKSFIQILIVTLVVALLVGTYSFADLGSNAQAAEYKKITGIEFYDFGVSSGSSGGIQAVARLDDGSQFNLPQNIYNQVTLQGDKKFRRIGTSEFATAYSVRLTNSGELYVTTKEGVETKVITDVKDFEIFPNESNMAYGSFYALLNDGTVQAWGRGVSGELGIGYKQDKTVPTEVVDPVTGDPIEGVRKIVQLGRDHTGGKGILLVTDTEVYLIGKAFAQNSFTNGKPVKLDIFPAFTNADFDMKYLENIPMAITLVEKNYNTNQTGATERRVFVINGKEYVLNDLYKAEDQPANNAPSADLLKTTLIPMPDGVSVSEIKRVNSYKTSSNSFGDTRTISTGLVRLDGGELSYWGTPFANFGSFSPGFEETPKVMATGVKSVSTASGGNFFYLRNNNVYAFGNNNGGRLGVLGGVQETPVRITGTQNEVKNVKQLAVGTFGAYALKDDGSLVYWSNDKDFRTLNLKFLSLFEVKRDFESKAIVYGIGEDMNFYQFSSYEYYQLGKGVLPALVPTDYVAPVTSPDKPILSIKEQDKFNQSVVTINYGSTGDIATKQYQVNAGGWQDYTGDILITQTGNVTVQARSADSKGNISEVAELTLTSNPIVITAGQPLLDKVSRDEFKISADATGVIKVQVKVDGGAWQDFNVANNLLLTPGEHTVEVRLLNERDQELINKSFNVIADTPAPVAISKPVIVQKGLNNRHGIDVDITYDKSEGEGLFSVDGGPWNTVWDYSVVGQFSLSNDVHTIQAKVEGVNGSVSEIVTFVTTKVDPKLTIDNNGDLNIDFGVNTPGFDVYYKDYVNNNWTLYTGMVNYPPGTYSIDVEVRENTSGDVYYSGGPFVIVVPGTDPNPGNGGTTPTPSPGNEVPVGQQDVDFTVFSGGLSARFEGADLSTIIIDSTNPYQSINSVSRALIEDSRGNGKGYQYSMDVTDFVSDPMQDNSLNKQSLIVSIPANSLSVNVGQTKTLNGPAAELSNVGKHVFTGNGPELLARAQAFEGMGYVEIPLDFTLSVPDRVKVVSSDSGSKFVPGELTGLMAGIYRSTIRSTLTSGI
ncbi:hypothetical protein ASD24_24650 [Paenibacillus sp. Root52]|uniref:RCC1 domain-containing protein n=1 Tax=Paenibacillus sp. Root52 TaxID=1736552 RepID=UPI0007014F6F|nr:RCC1 domain-containing protein [Paenibacillus sp. Root52]KQY90989.1 hypothetical protein ASD24_24650 [Paenibacillus sp. Root52]